jgi:hypothetical protein
MSTRTGVHLIRSAKPLYLHPVDQTLPTWTTEIYDQIIISSFNDCSDTFDL